MIKKYQTDELDTSALAVPEQVSVAMDEIAADMREGLLAFAVGAGLQVVLALTGMQTRWVVFAPELALPRRLELSFP